MKTECTQRAFDFQRLGRRDVVAQFDGGTITSDAGGLLLGEVEKRLGIVSQFARCFTDYRDPDLVEHPLQDLIAQRVYALALGYEDLNDHDRLREDPLMSVLVGKADPLGASRLRAKDRGKALCGKSTLNRLELTPKDASAQSRYKKILYDPNAVDRFFVEVFLQSMKDAPDLLILDLDATDDPLHGNQEGRFFHGYYREYCYLPLYIFCGDQLLCARLRSADQDPAAGALEEVSRIVSQIRAKFPSVQILVRGDGGFCRDELMTWCERNGVDYLLGLAKNSRLIQEIQTELARAKEESERTKRAARVFKDFSYRTRESWSTERRVVGKAEHLEKGSNPRFVVTSLAPTEYEARSLYEEIYCARGEMENRIKEQQLYLFADRTSTKTMRGNQLRLWFSSLAYLLIEALRRLGLAGTELARAQCHTIRLKLFKIGAQIAVSARKIWISLTQSYPYLELWEKILSRLRSLAPASG